MIKFENPMQFNLHKESDSIKVDYSNLMEIAQGGPEIGNLFINGKQVKNYRFGGPCIIQNDFIFVPVYIKRFFGTCFKLSKINSKDFSIKIIGKSKDLIYLDKIESNKIYFFEDINKSKYSYYELE